MEIGHGTYDGATFKLLQLYVNVIGETSATVPYMLTHWNFELNTNQNYTWTVHGPPVGLVRLLQFYVAPYSDSVEAVDYM